MNNNSLILRDIEKNPLEWLIECPKCRSMVNAKYALALAPTLGATYILPHFYCHCTRFQIMEPRPAKLVSFQIIVIVYAFIIILISKMINYVLRKT